MKIVVIDNYDSFTYNLVQYIQEIVARKIDVFRNDAISVDELEQYDVVVLSPGPGLPKDAGIMPELIKTYAATKSIFGVCLGMQAIGEAFGGRLVNLEAVYHGVATTIKVIDNQDFIYDSLPNSFTVGRYHSWVVESNSLGNNLLPTSVDEGGQLMSLRHKSHHVKGVQFHPESIMTPFGKQILSNFLVEARLRMHNRESVRKRQSQC